MFIEIISYNFTLKLFFITICLVDTDVYTYTFTENESPQISGNTTINVHVNKTVKFKFEISDDGKTSPRYVVLKKPDHFVLDNRTGIATWTPINDDVSEIR